MALSEFAVAVAETGETTEGALLTTVGAETGETAEEALLPVAVAETGETTEEALLPAAVAETGEAVVEEPARAPVCAGEGFVAPVAVFWFCGAVEREESPVAPSSCFIETDFIAGATTGATAETSGATGLFGAV